MDLGFEIRDSGYPLAGEKNNCCVIAASRLLFYEFPCYLWHFLCNLDFRRIANPKSRILNPESRIHLAYCSFTSQCRLAPAGRVRDRLKVKSVQPGVVVSLTGRAASVGLCASMFQTPGCCQLTCSVTLTLFAVTGWPRNRSLSARVRSSCGQARPSRMGRARIWGRGAPYRAATPTSCRAALPRSRQKSGHRRLRQARLSPLRPRHRYARTIAIERFTGVT